MQPHSLYAEIIVEGERQEVLLFGSRLKFFGTSNFLQDLAIYIGYAENGTTFTAIRAEEKAYGFCCNPCDYVQPIHKTRWIPEQPQQQQQQMLSLKAGGREHTFTLSVMEASGDKISQSGKLVVDDKVFVMQNICFDLPRCPTPHEGKNELVKLLEFPQNQSSELILSTADVHCKNPELAVHGSPRYCVDGELLQNILRNSKCFEGDRCLPE
ncbi:uncharacterized protein LOC108864401 [Galendromus occidentalis]|uniref:Uncharacterized protein LOC108864401 n=1 Tax=Galendromus occidentalis TaxID=34638 RepID=A0AAJ7WIW3_9ACAR|nr:uncharacterized protein LOC108864401 [Galendromus occidentalis]